MPGVGEAGAQDAFVAGDDDGAVVLRLDVGDEAEPWRGGAFGGSQGEITLVDAHRDLHDLGRQIHVRVCDAAEVRDGPLDQTGDLVQQAGIVHHDQGFFGGQAGNAVGDHTLAVGGIHQDAAGGQSFPPVVGSGDGERVGRMEAMALGQVAAGQAVPVIGTLTQIKGNDVAVQQAGDAAQWANPDKAAAATPTH